MPQGKAEFPDDPKLQALVAKRMAQDATGELLLTKPDYARLQAASEYPKDKTLQDLSGQRTPFSRGPI